MDENALFRLHQFMIHHYNLEEIKTLCFELQILYDDLGGEGLSAKVREILLLLGREKRFAQLLYSIRESRSEAIKTLSLELDSTGAYYNALPFFTVSSNAPPTYIPATAPLPPTHFTGRRQILDDLKNAIQGDSKNFPKISLHGMGGVGKTSTLLMLANEISSFFPGGIFWCSLPEHHGSAESILQSWGKLCGRDIQLSNEQAKINLTILIRGLLVERKAALGPLILLVDDVRKEWLEEARLLLQVQSNGIPMILTTRDEALAVTLSSSVYHIDVLSIDESLELLRFHKGKNIVEQKPQDNRSLVEALGQLPLAIELAGKYLQIFARKPGDPLRALNKALKQNPFEALELPGHSSLASTFAISYQTLSVEEQKLFRWMGIFANAPIKSSYISGVLEWPIDKCEAILDGLVDRALLAWTESINIFMMHPLLRQYAQKLLSSTDEEISAKLSHLRYFNGSLFLDVPNENIAINFAYKLIRPPGSPLPYSISEQPLLYCTHCRSHQHPIFYSDYLLKNGKRVLKGYCSVCGWKMFKLKKPGSS